MKIVKNNTNKLPELNQSGFENLFQDNEIYMVYDDKNEFIGAYQLVKVYSGIDLRVGIAENKRRNGFGSDLLNLAYEQAKKTYNEGKALGYILKDNYASIKMAEKCGFDRDEDMDPEYVIMYKDFTEKKDLQK